MKPSDQETKEALEGLQVVYSAAANAPLTAAQHQLVQAAGEKVAKVLNELNGTNVESPSGDIEVVKD